jgi:hypothetical protein
MSRRFTMVPEMWTITLRSPGATAADWNLSLLLLERAKFSPFVKVTNVVATKIGLCGKTKQRSLARLERWGLVLVRRRRGASPRVTMKWLVPMQPSSGPGPGAIAVLGGTSMS